VDWIVRLTSSGPAAPGGRGRLFEGDPRTQGSFPEQAGDDEREDAGEETDEHAAQQQGACHLGG